uniref:FZ domain-containing protein n=1 Tax=Ascaris lumbricoides TaxID=6252 RepID=A0A0M3IWP0_ASCLU
MGRRILLIPQLSIFGKKRKKYKMCWVGLEKFSLPYFSVSRNPNRHRISEEIRETIMKEFIGTAIVLIILLLQYEVGAIDVEFENCKEQNKKTDFCKLLFEKTPQNCHDPGYQSAALVGTTFVFF